MGIGLAYVTTDMNIWNLIAVVDMGTASILVLLLEILMLAGKGLGGWGDCW